MENFSAETFAAGLALIGGVIVVAALLSGVIERTGLPQVAVFLALGAALGPTGLGVLNIGLTSPALRIIATLSLVLVLFTDAVTLNLKEVSKHRTLALVVLGPGTLLSAALIALAGWGLLGLPVAGAAILGAALASTDPVLLRGLLRRPDVPSAARQALRLESGLNDVVLLPIVLVAMAFLGHDAPPDAGEWAKLALDLFLLGPGAGIAVGVLAVATLDLVRHRIGIRRDYESLYSLGVAFAAFAAAESVHGSGFLAAFAAGLTISALDVELCDCFLEYGETTAEMTLLLTFVLFGSSLIWTGFSIFSWTTLLFVVLVLMIRPVAFLFSLARQRLSKRARLLISWFGPRGLSTLLLVLLPVFDGLPGSERLFTICCLVVLFSVVLHGGTPLLLSRTAQPPSAKKPPQPPTATEIITPEVVTPPPPALAAPEHIVPIVTPAADGQVTDGSTAPPPSIPKARALPVLNSERGEKESEEEPDRYDRERISLDQVRQLWEQGAPVIIVDARTQRTYEIDEVQAKGAIRLNPDNAARQAAALDLPRDAWIIAYCA